MDMATYREMIESCIIKCYSPIDEISGWNLHELGQWIDIVKDIAEMQYYDEKAKHTDMDVSKM